MLTLNRHKFFLAILANTNDSITSLLRNLRIREDVSEGRFRAAFLEIKARGWDSLSKGLAGGVVEGCHTSLGFALALWLKSLELLGSQGRKPCRNGLVLNLLTFGGCHGGGNREECMIAMARMKMRLARLLGR